MKIAVKGSTMVKPMQETPGGSVWLSSLDLVFPDTYHTRWVNFYRSDGAVNFFDTSVLKAALSHALVEFYPYAGRLRKDVNGRLEIYCNGEGVLFVEVECDGTVDDLCGFNPRPDLSLVPNVDYSNGISFFPLFLLQLTRFKCGGVSLGFTVGHHVADAVSALHFINTWSEIARGLTPAVAPSLDRRLFLSPRNPPRPKFPHIEHRPPPSLKTPAADLQNSDDKSFSTFRLTPVHINALKRRCKTNDDIGYTTYEVVAGHVWRCVTIARGLPGDQETKLQLPVNARLRLKPPLPPGFFGNGIFFTGAFARCGELRSKPLKFAVEKVREAIARMDGEYLRSAVDYVELHLGTNNAEAEGIVRSVANVNAPNFAMTSWVGLPFYEPDFGWGKPVYCGPGAVMYEGTSFLAVDPQNEGSLLLSITLHKHHMNQFHKLFFHGDDELSVISKI